MADVPDRASAEPGPRRYEHPASSRGTWTIVAILALGFAVLIGLYVTGWRLPPPAKAPPATTRTTTQPAS